MSHMLDLATIQTWETPALPARPEVGALRVDDKLDMAARFADRHANEYEDAARRWIDTAKVKQRDIVSLNLAKLKFDDEVLKATSVLIQDLEYQLELKSIQAAAFRKAGPRRARLMTVGDPPLRRIVDHLVRRLIAADDQMVEAIMQHALFFRGLRAQHGPLAKVSQRTLADLRQEIERRPAA